MPNNLNTSELFSSNPGEFLQRGGSRADYTSDSAFNSSQSFTSSATNSQIIGSQMENSQSSSFDLFSQMMSQQQGYSQQNESTSSNFYMKYMSKPPLFQKENASKKTSLPRRKSFQGMQEFNRERAKERDDRDLINTFIAIVKECADEVKHAASSIKKDVDTNISETTTRTAAVMSKIANELAQHHRQLLDSLKTRGDHESKLQELMETIASKDAQIQLLESQLATARTDRNEHLLKAMLDMYTEQQNVTRQHLDKVHEEQQNIKDQQSKLLEETEKSHATLNRMTSAPSHPKGDDNERMYVERDTNHPRCSSVPLMPAGIAFSRSKHLSGSGWSDAAEQSRAPPLQTNGQNHQHNVSTQFQVNQINAAISNQVPTQSSTYHSSSHHGVLDDVAPRMERSRGLRNTTSHLFQLQPTSYRTPHQMSSTEYAMQPVMRPESMCQPQGSFGPCLSQYGEQPGGIKNPLQDRQNIPTSTSYPTSKRPSCYENFNNKFSSPTYSSSDRQLWSKKNLKPSPVATIAPQIHNDLDELQDHQAPPGSRKQNRQKRSRMDALESNQPQRKSARLSARASPGNANDFHSSREERKKQSRGAGRKSKPKNKRRPRSVAPLVRENESQEDDSESEGETATIHWKEKVPSAQRSNAHFSTQVKKQPAIMKQVHRHSTVPNKKTQKASTIVGRQNDSSSEDDDDEYTFHDEPVEQPATTLKAFHTVKRSTSCGGEVQHEQQEVFTRRSVITYSTPKATGQRSTPVQVSSYSERPQNNPTKGRQGTCIKDSSRQESRISGQLKQPVASSQDIDILDAIQTYTQSEDEDSSQEIHFSLILPDACDLQRKQNPGPPRWSSVMSPSVNSQYTEQVVPDQPQCKRSSKNLATSRKRRMIYGSRDDLRKTMAQLVHPMS